MKERRREEQLTAPCCRPGGKPRGDGAKWSRNDVCRERASPQVNWSNTGGVKERNELLHIHFHLSRALGVSVSSV